MPLMNSQVWENAGGGKSTAREIVGFAAFELDCPYMKSTGNWEPSAGTFVQLLDFQGVTGNPQGADTGVETIILMQ